MSSLNCWEAKKCERQPGGAKVSELGVCPVTTTSKVNGVNGGKNGGRVCWAIAGTLCGGKVQGIPAFLFIPLDGQPQMSTGYSEKAEFEKIIFDILKIKK